MAKTYKRSPAEAAFVQKAVRASQAAYARMENYTPEQGQQLAERSRAIPKRRGW